VVRRHRYWVDFEIENKLSGRRFRLLEDDTLRDHCGYVIGRIAASHNWPIEDLLTYLPKRVGAITGLPNGWSVDPLKLACLLRCADAVQIDQRRAPDFLYALLRLRGISETHWRAQNKLAQAMPDPDDAGSLLFTSTQPYLEVDADGWWLAYDLIGIVDRELRSSDSLLRNTKRKPFQINRVKDADSPERLSKLIRTVGWTPINAELHVTNVENVARVLGGFELYGNNPLVPFRELIQNAADAVRARRFIDKHNRNYQGRISLALRKESTQGGSCVWLDVEDNGVGMSERVLTGPLLDFGTSLWRNTLVEQEFPGLRGGRYQATGQFGIGFYSIFMIADQIAVATKRFDAGHEHGRQLVFKKGLSSRPLLIRGLPHDFGTELSTRVSIRLKPGRLIDYILSIRSDRAPPRRITFAERIASLCPSLDCDVYCQEFGKGEVLAHTHKWYDQDGEEWLYRITMPYGNINRRTERLISEAAKRLRAIEEGDKVLGRAAISLSTKDRDFLWREFSMGHLTIGGLSSDREPINRVYPRAEGTFAGTLEARALRASRYSNGFELFKEIAASQRTLKKWAQEQLELLSGRNLSDEQQDFATANFLSFGILIPEYVHAYRYKAGTTIREDSELERINVRKFLKNRRAVRIACPVEYSHIKSPFRFGLDDSEQATKLMKEFGLTELLMPTFDFGDWCKIPHGAAGAKIKCFANVLLAELRTHNSSVEMKQFRSKTGMNGAICFSTTKHFKLNPGARAR
jgi:hypothetical protein